MLTLCGRCGTYGTGLPLVARLVAAAPGVAPDDMEVTFVWHATRGTYGTVLVAHLFAGALRCFVWQAWRLVTWTPVVSKCGSW